MVWSLAYDLSTSWNWEKGNYCFEPQKYNALSLDVKRIGNTSFKKYVKNVSCFQWSLALSLAIINNRCLVNLSLYVEKWFNYL